MVFYKGGIIMESLNLTTNTSAPAVVNEKPLCTVDVDQALQEWEAYQKITSKMLDETDYQDIGVLDIELKAACTVGHGAAGFAFHGDKSTGERGVVLVQNRTFHIAGLGLQGNPGKAHQQGEE